MHHLPDTGPIAILFALATHLYHKANPRPAAFCLFSDIAETGKSRGSDLAKYLFDHQNVFGKYFETGKEINPRTGSVIRVWILSMNHETFRAWFTEETMNRLSTE